ncbi:hypothetical protein ACFSKM_06275 [Ancylobacter dichloromethanicus]
MAKKHTALTLCSLGKERAQALAAQYLSPTSPMSLVKNDPPAAILAMTLHTVETARPIARAWNMALTAPPIGYVPIRNNRYFNAKLNVVNREVVRDLMEKSALARPDGGDGVGAFPHRQRGAGGGIRRRGGDAAPASASRPGKGRARRRAAHLAGQQLQLLLDPHL